MCATSGQRGSQAATRVHDERDRARLCAPRRVLVVANMARACAVCSRRVRGGLRGGVLGGTRTHTVHLHDRDHEPIGAQLARLACHVCQLHR